MKHRATIVATERKHKEFFIEPARHMAAGGGCCWPHLLRSMRHPWPENEPLCNHHPVVLATNQAFPKEAGRLLQHGQRRVCFIPMLLHVFT